MPEALIEWTMLMDTIIWARNLSSDPFYLANARNPMLLITNIKLEKE